MVRFFILNFRKPHAMKFLFALILLTLGIVPTGTLQASDFGSMFSGTSVAALSGQDDIMSDADIGAMLQAIEPAAGGRNTGRNVRIDTTGNIKIRSGDYSSHIVRRRSGQ